MADLASRWRTEATDVGWSIDLVEASIDEAAEHVTQPDPLPASVVIEAVSQQRSSWTRADVLQAFCDLQQPVSQLSGRRWATTVEHATDQVLAQLVDLDPRDRTMRRESDGRSVWIEPTAARFTSEPVLDQEEAIITWALDAHNDPPTPSTTVKTDGLDGLQGDAAAAVAGHDRLVLVVGPAGAGKTRMLTAAGADLHDHGRVVFAVAPTAKAARTLERDTAIPTDTVAKLLHEWQRSDRAPLPEFRLPAGATLIVDEAGMLSTPALHHLTTLADTNRWRVALVGDPRQLQGVGRGGLLAELCNLGRVVQLEQLHRFTHPWEAAASLQLRAGDPQALDAYERHGRIHAGTLDDHLDRIAATWIDHHDHDHGHSVAVVASTNDHVDTINRAVQAARIHAGHLDPHGVTALVGAGEWVRVGDVIATRCNDRRLITTTGQPVRNRDTWTVTAIDRDGSMTVSHQTGHGNVTLPADYVTAHVRLGYAATEHGWQSDTVTTAIALTSPATTRRGLYVAATRGSEANVICVITDSNDITEARDTLEGILAVDRADIPAVTQRRNLTHQEQLHRPAEPPRPATPTPRCAIPDWFGPLLEDAQRQLADAEQRPAELAARRHQLTAAAAAADRAITAAAAAAAPDLDAYNDATTRAAAARAHLADTQQRLHTAPRLRRHTLRRDVADAHRQVQRAEDYLERTRQRTAPTIERHQTVLAERQRVTEQLRTCDTRDRITTMLPTAADCQRRVTALTAWQRWAQGHHITPDALHHAITELRPEAGQLSAPTSRLGYDLQHWADNHPGFPVEPPARALNTPTIGPGLGL